MYLYNMYLYRIYTERVLTIQEIRDIVRGYFKGATIYPAEGVWKDENELSWVVEIFSAKRRTLRARSLATEIKNAGNQESVLLLEILVNNCCLL